MEEFKDYGLRPVWDKLLDLYERFDAFCKEHHLRYYVTGGTLLGAVRHNGFIPWDDDFDVVMPRPDYQRLITMREQVAGARIMNMDTDSDFTQLFSKAWDLKQDRVWIDVIPIDGMPSGKLAFQFWLLKNWTFRHRDSKALHWRILYFFLWGFHKDEADERHDFDRWLSSLAFDTAPFVDDLNGNRRRYARRCLTAASFGEPVYHAFDRVQVPMPRDYAKFLTLIFGPDYMTPPAEGARNGGHQNETCVGEKYIDTSRIDK